MEVLSSQREECSSEPVSRKRYSIHSMHSFGSQVVKKLANFSDLGSCPMLPSLPVSMSFVGKKCADLSPEFVDVPEQQQQREKSIWLIDCHGKLSRSQTFNSKSEINQRDEKGGIDTKFIPSKVAWKTRSSSLNSPQKQPSLDVSLPQTHSVIHRIRDWLREKPKLVRGLFYSKKLENVRMLDRYNSRKPSTGTLYLTTTHLIFVDPDGKKETWILLTHVASVQKLPLSTLGAPLHIRCKTFQFVTFIVPKERECHDLYTSLQQLAQPMHMQDLYCFHYTASVEDIPRKAGWHFFHLQAEFQRMGIPNEQWVLTSLNKNYELCDTYPQDLFVPKSASAVVLMGSANFRSKGRLPVLSYYHQNGAALCRCSQPLSGFSARCIEDEQLLTCILQSNFNSKFMYVVDTRPRINAMANRAAGKGYENENFYDNIKFQFWGIENIHVMRSSLAKLMETCELKTPSMAAFWAGLQSSGWLRHIQSVLETASAVARALDDGVSVIVHCSDGWDRTAQVCSLAALLLDPYYRTLQGYQALIEKEWLAFGHKFTDRCGFLQGDGKEVSPIFSQLIDCTWQLTQMFPSAFQFNERFLLLLHDHVYSCQFGTFVGNCEKDRLDLKLDETSYSLWGYVSTRCQQYVNPLYSVEAYEKTLTPNLVPQNIKFWRGLYCRFESGVHPRESLGDVAVAARDHSNSLQEHITFLQKRIMALKKLLEVQSSNNDDNKMSEEKSITESTGQLNEKLESLGLQTVLDHPLSSNYANGESVFVEVSMVSVEQLNYELKSVALDWKSLRNIRECVCSTPFDHFSKKSHCWGCGDVFCTRCIDKQTSLPGHDNKKEVPVCRPCFKQIRRSSSSSTTP